MNKYFIVNDWDGKSYLCYMNQRPNHYWSKFEDRGDRKKMFYLHALFMLWTIKILARDINCWIERCEE